MSVAKRIAFTDVTLAMDLSLSSPGFAILALFEGKPIILEKSFVKTTASKSHGFRLCETGNEISRYLRAYEPAYIVREKGFSRFPATTQALFKVVGVSDMLAHIHSDKVIAEISPTSIKKIVAGSGKASKLDVQDAVIRMLQIEQADYFSNDDESDAAAVGLAYMKQKGLIA